MNKKITSSTLAALMIAGSTSFSAFAAMSNGTVVIGNKAFDLAYANNPANASEITNAIVGMTSGQSVYVKDFDGKWIDNATNKTVEASVIPSVVYKGVDKKEVKFDAADKDVATTTGSAIAINATTVEVTYNEAVSDVNATKYTIEGLTVVNAAVKQTDNKVVVLTTSAQEAKEYTVKAGEVTIGKFTGMSVVIPSAIKVSSNSQQGIVGKNVTISAAVTVAEGQAKAGIPVTFNVNAGAVAFNLNHVVEVKTDANGVASYSYTQYAGGEDLVTAYATGNANVRSTTGKVYWGVKDRLTITEVTTADTLANGSKKVYKVKATTPTGGNATGFVNVAFAENIDVTPEKGVRDVKVTDATNGYGIYPYQYTNGNTKGVHVALINGEATFTLTGVNASVTPIVFFDTNADDLFATTDLQAKTETVKFENIQLVQVAVESLGTTDAAGITAAGKGGRDYKVTVTDKNGKLAPKGTLVSVTVDTDDLEGVVYLSRTATNGGDFQFNGTNVVTVKTDANGVATFTLIGNKLDYATPTVFVDNGTVLGELDKSDAQTRGGIVYFGDAEVTAATVKVKNSNDLATTVESVKADETAVFEYQVVDQNGKTYKAGTHNATFEVFNNGYNTVYANGVPVQSFKSASVPFSAINGLGTLSVTSTGITSVNVNVSGSQYTLGNQTASVNFTANRVLPSIYTGVITLASQINSVDDEITFAGYDTVTYSTASFKNIAGVVIDETEFVANVRNIIANAKYAKVSAVKNSDGTYALEIVEEVVPAGVNHAPEAKTGLDKVVTINGAITTFVGSDLATDIDADTLTITSAVSTDPTKASVAVNAGSLVVTSAVAGTATIFVTVTDGTVSINVPVTFTVENLAAVLNVHNLINAFTLPNATQVEVTAARGAYNALTAGQKALVVAADLAKLTTEESKLAANSAAQTVAATELAKVVAAQANYVTAGGKIIDVIYTNVTIAKNAVNAAVTANVTADIVSTTATLTTATGVLNSATLALTNAKTAAALEIAKVAAAQTDYVTAGGTNLDVVYVAVTIAKTNLDTAVASNVTADILTKTLELTNALNALK